MRSGKGRDTTRRRGVSRGPQDGGGARRAPVCDDRRRPRHFPKAAAGHCARHAHLCGRSPGKLELTGRDPLHGMIVSLIDDDGKVSDVTRRVSYEMDRTDIASADERGMVTGLSDGQATLTVKFAELSAAVSVSVATIADKPAPSFKNDILPILTRSGCNMGGCHGKLAGQNGFRLSPIPVLQRPNVAKRKHLRAIRGTK